MCVGLDAKAFIHSYIHHLFLRGKLRPMFPRGSVFGWGTGTPTVSGDRRLDGGGVLGRDPEEAFDQEGEGSVEGCLLGEGHGLSHSRGENDPGPSVHGGFENTYLSPVIVIDVRTPVLPYLRRGTAILPHKSSYWTQIGLGKCVADRREELGIDFWSISFFLLGTKNAPLREDTIVSPQNYW